MVVIQALSVPKKKLSLAVAKLKIFSIRLYSHHVWGIQEAQLYTINVLQNTASYLDFNCNYLH